MTDERVDPLSGVPVVVTGSRQDRPNLPEEGCPFCPGGLEAPEPYDTRWFPNRWPPFPDGRAEILLFSPDHDASLSTLGPAGVERVVRLWADRTRQLGGRDDVAYVLLFENRGDLVGATIPHPHGQVYAFTNVPPVPRTELAQPSCALCDPPAPARLVHEDAEWTTVVPVAPLYPYELLIAPRRHVPDLLAGDDVVLGLARALDDAVRRLDQLFDAPMPYMLWVHQRPTDGGHWPLAHLHLHLAPAHRAPGLQRFVAAGELGSGVWFDPVVPEEAAARLAALPGAAGMAPSVGG